MAEPALRLATELTQVATDLPPPCDLDAEGTVLSHCFEHGPIPGLLPKHFYSDANRWVYQAITDLHARTVSTDPVSVAHELTVLDRLEQVGGRHYLAILCHCQPATAYPDRFAETIRELYRQRVLSDACLELRVALRVGTVTAGEAWARFKAICEELSNE